MMAVGALLVAGLIVWALTRTVESPAPMVSSTITPSSETTGSVVPPIDSTISVVPPINTVSNPPTTTGAITTSSAAPVGELPQGDRTEVARISAEDLHEKVKAGTVTVIDTRHDESAYTAGHIPGAMFIPMTSISANLDRIPKGKEVVTYCT